MLQIMIVSEDRNVPSPRHDLIQAALDKKPDAVLDFVAKDVNASLNDVIRCLPERQVVALSGDQFDAVMKGAAGLGLITFIVHTEDIVLECKGSVPEGGYGRGFYNIHGEGPIGGHIKADNCAAIYFVSREMMGRQSHSLIFCNKAGNAMFKIYLGRDENRDLIPEQVEEFNRLKQKFI